MAPRLGALPASLTVTVVSWDATDVGAHDQLMIDATATLGEIDLVLSAVGVLGHHAGVSMPAAEVDEMISPGRRPHSPPHRPGW